MTSDRSSSGSHARPRETFLSRTPVPSIRIEQRSDGSILALSTLSLPLVAQSLPHLFEATALVYPCRIFMRQRVAPGSAWLSVTYGEARQKVRSIAQWFLDQGVQQGDVVAIISGPSISHALLMLGAQTCGMAVAPLSAGYALLSSDHAKLKRCVAQSGARYVFADDAQAFSKALGALAAQDSRLQFVVGEQADASVNATPLDVLFDTTATAAVDTAMNAITQQSLARLMFTSGSTGAPKAVPQRQACLTVTVAQSEVLGLLDFDGEGPQHLEAMPFSHIMAGNFNFNNVVRAGGTIHIDDGKPTPQLFHHTLANLREISPHFFLTVPAGYAMLCHAMEKDAGLRDKFFENLRYIGFGGAVLPDQVAARLQKLALAARGERVPIYSFYGATEFLFGAMQYWNSERMDVIGLPVPGIEVKLAPVENKLEFRVRGPTLMAPSGYLNEAIPPQQLFDEEGFFRTGDAVRWLNPQHPEQGLVFDGRIAEDFKMSTGTWVSVASLRVDVLSACDPFVSEAVICGLNQEWLGALLWLNETAVRFFLGDAGSNLSSADLTLEPRIAQALRRAIEKHNAASPGSARRLARVLIVAEPLSYDANEVTDKGNASQHMVRTLRAADIERLYAADARQQRDIICFDT